MTFVQRTSSSLVNIGNQTVNIPEPLDVTFLSPQPVTVDNTVSVDITNVDAIDVSVTNIPEVTINGTTTVSIDGTPTVTVGNTSGSPVPVAFSATPNVNVANTPAVTISNAPNVSVTNTPNVTISGTPNVAVTNTPTVTVGNLSGSPVPVTFPSTQNVNVANTPAVTVSGTPNVAVTNTPSVTVSNTPNVAVTNTPTVTVSNASGSPVPVSFPSTPDVNIANTPTVTVGNVSGSPIPVSFPSTPSVNVANTPAVTVSNTPNVAVTNTPTVTVGNSVLNVKEQSAPTTAFGERLVGMLQPKAAWRFDYGSAPNTKIVSTSTSNGGTVTVSNSKAVLSTSTNASGSASMRTINVLRYLNGIGGLARFTGVFTTGVANSRQLIGIGDTRDGLFFGYMNGFFGIVRRKNVTDNFTAIADWNGTPVTFDPTLGNVFQIRYQWLGYGFIRFYILDPSNQANGFTLVHTINYPNTTPDVSILNPTLPLWAEVINTGNTSNLTLQTPSGAAFTEGKTSDSFFNPLDIYRSLDNSATIANSSVNHFITIRNKSIYASTDNRMPVSLREISVGRSAAGANISRIRIFKNATTAAALTYADIDTNNSPIEFSTTTTTVTTATTAAERTYALSTVSTNGYFKLLDGELVLQPGESLTLAIENNQNTSTEVVANLVWCEQF